MGNKLIIIIITMMNQFMDEDKHLWAKNCGNDNDYTNRHQVLVN